MQAVRVPDHIKRGLAKLMHLPHNPASMARMEDSMPVQSASKQRMASDILQQGHKSRHPLDLTGE
jgi:hypothetical protein